MHNLPVRALTISSILVLASTLYGCRLNPFGGVQWESDFLLPIARAEAGARDLVRDSTFLDLNPDGVLVFSFRDTLAELNLADIAEFPDTAFTYTVSLKTLDLSTAPFTQSLTLGAAARQLVADGNLLGLVILANHGNTFPGIPPLPGLRSGAITIDASEFFQFAEVSSGRLELTIQNGFPLDIDSVILEVSNRSTPAQPLIADTFLTIPAGASVTRSYPLDNQVIESQLIGELVNLNIAGGSTVPIDTTDAILVSIQAKDLRARTATAVFPAQVLTDTLRSNIYNFRESGLEITEVQFSGGEIRLSSISTISDSILFVYALPDARNSAGQIPEVSLKVRPAPNSGFIQQTETRNLAGFTLRMDPLARPPFNVLRDRVRTELLFSGNLVTLDETDSLRVDFGLLGLKPIAARGFFGKADFRFQGQQSFSGFKGLNITGLNLTEASAELRIENKLGLDADLTLRKLEARNTVTGQALPLAGAATLAGPVRIQGLVWPDTASTTVTRIGFLPGNSNINPLLNLQPDVLAYDVAFRTNPQTPANYRDNFATQNSRLGAYVSICVPLVGSVGQWTLRDTAAVAFGQINIDQVSEATLRLRLENGFPLEALASVDMLDADHRVIRNLLTEKRIAGSPADDRGIATQPTETLLDFTLTQTELRDLLEQGRSVALFARFSSVNAPASIQLLDSYRLRAFLSAQIRYQIEP